MLTIFNYAQHTNTGMCHWWPTLECSVTQNAALAQCVKKGRLLPHTDEVILGHGILNKHE